VAVRDNEVLGTVRLIKHSKAGFPIENNFELEELPFVQVPRNEIVEISRLAPKNTISVKGEVLIGLIKTIYNYSINYSIYHWYLAADMRIFKYLSHFGFVLTPLGEPKIYMGSLTIPAYVEIRAGMKYLKQINPKLYAFFANEPVEGFEWYEYQD
jgi:N-acyl-L-homoserine lactone synthetase